MKNIKLTVGIVFVLAIVAALAVESFAYPPFVAKARKFGAKDCTFCHVEPEGGAPWNERGKWLMEEKAKRNADAVDVEWLAEYKKPGAMPAKPDDKKPAAASASSASAVEQELLKLERAWLDAYQKHDVAAMERIEADDFSITHSNGQVITKAQEIANLKKAGPGESSMTFSTEETKVRLFGDTAILNGIVVMKGNNSTQRSRYTDVYVKRNGQWQVVASHLSQIPAPAAPASSSSAAAPSSPAAPASAAKADPKSYDAYVGQYDTPFGVLNITKEGDKLFGQPGTDSKEELIPESTDQFNVPNVGAKLKFVKDANGMVTHLVINIQGQEMQAKKIK